MYLEYRAEFSCASASFTGYASDADYNVVRDELWANATAAGFSIQTDAWYLVGYDSPFEIEGRLNEVWLVLDQ